MTSPALKKFFVDTLSSALEIGIATPDDVVRHVTADVLSTHLPRPLWARLLTACLGASVVDAQLVIDTVGVTNLCEHVPLTILWPCVAELGARALGGITMSPPSAWASRPSTPAPLSLAPPPDAPASVAVTPAAQPEPPRGSRPAIAPPPTGTQNPLADLVAEMDANDPPVGPPSTSGSGRPRTSTRQPFRQSSTGIGRPTTPPPSPRRPQAQAAPVTPAVTTPAAVAASVIEAGTTRARRGQTEVGDYDIETDVRPADDYRATSDDQLVDWSSSEETVTGGDEFDRKPSR